MIKKLSWYDALAVAFLGLISYGLIAFLSHGNYWETGYQDWIYHVFRVHSFQMNGLISWDHIWSNGVSYWKSYQIVPTLAAAGVAAITHLTPAQAMIACEVGLFILLRLSIYLAARVWGFNPLISFVLAIASFLFVGQWNQLEDYSIAFAAPLLPLMLILWRFCFVSQRARYFYAFLTGLSLYIHPLLAVPLGSLWLFSIPWQLDTFRRRQFVIEAVLMAVPVLFFAYGLLYLDHSTTTQIQLTHGFIVSLSPASRLAGLYLSILLISWAFWILRPGRLSVQARILLLYGSILWLAIFLNTNTTYLDFLNRFQIVRAGHVVAICLLFPFGEAVSQLQREFTRTWLRFWPYAFIAYTLTFAAYAASTFGPSPSQDYPDPVQHYFETHQVPTGAVYLANSLISSVNNPQIRFTNGYNEHLLSQFLDVRLEKLLTSPNVSYRPTYQELSTADQYARVLDVQYLFLPKSSAYVETLTTPAFGYTIVGEETSRNYDLAVLMPPWQAHNGTVLSDSQAATLQGCVAHYGNDETEFYRQLDSCVSTLSATLYAADATVAEVSYPTPDSLAVSTPHGGDRWVYVDETYSQDWVAPAGVSVQKSGEGMLLLHLSPSVEGMVTIQHTWGTLLSPYLLLMDLLTFLFLILLLKPNILRSLRHG